MIPLSFIMTDATTGLLVDSGSCTFPYCSINLIAQIPGNSYNLTITDGCGGCFGKETNSVANCRSTTR
ncbi:MAG: hypothetical protein IPJ26_17155 [Bacteroidetes bacterium]|nr:hypothetical protein [Bacteroidota bacterium]